MERCIEEKLRLWKDKINRKPLLVTGARRCGKTYTIKQFGQREFASAAYLNLAKDSAAAAVFAYDCDVRRIIDELGHIVLERPVIPGETLLVLDEIQACPRAISALKYFCEDMPELHVIAAGSTLGAAVEAQTIDFPEGEIECLSMYPLSFPEFAAAGGQSAVLDGLRSYGLGEPLPELYTTKLEKLLKQYFIVGGMPEAVQIWADTRDYSLVDELQRAVLEGYARDFAANRSLAKAQRIRMLWDSIPVQLARENNKFVFSHVKKGARAKELEDALEWLNDAGLIYKSDLAAQPELPLSDVADKTFFKVYMSDVGLLRQKANLHYRSVLAADDNYARFKWALAENYVLIQLKAMGVDSWFWRSDASAEIDFITDCEGLLTPIEVKAADNTKAKSLRLFCQRYNPKLAFKLSLRNIGVYLENSTEVWSLPLYAVHRLKEYLAAAD